MRGIITFLLLNISIISFSQIHKGQWLIGGNAAFSYAKSTELKMTTLQFSPAIGYFFINRTVGGLRFNSNSNTYDWNDDKRRYTDNSLAPFIRYYFLPQEQKVNLFADASYGFAWSKYKNFTYSERDTYKFHTVSFMAGPAIFLNQHTALEFSIGYTHSSRGPIDSSATSKLQLGIGLQIHFGKPKD
jgi:hypothetical protein